MALSEPAATFLPKTLICLILCVSLPLIGSLAYAEMPLVIDADKQYDFAQHYFKNGEYGRAIDEYQRFIYFFPNDERVERADFQIAMAYYLSRQYPEAIDAFREVIRKYDGSRLAVESYYKLSDSYMRHHQLDAAIVTLHNLLTLSDSAVVRDEAFYRLGWIYIEAGLWDNARSNFNKISPQAREKYKLERLSNELDQAGAIPRKNPGLAGALSVVPGAGYLYLQRYQDALIAFLLNGVFIWASYEAFDNDNNALGALLSFFELSFYAGSIYGTVSSAHKYNRTKTEQFIENLKRNTKIDLAADPGSKSLRISLRYTF